MAIKYKKLFHLLIDKNLKPSDLKKLAGLSAPTISKLQKDKIVQTDVISRICTALNVQPGDIMENIVE